MVLTYEQSQILRGIDAGLTNMANKRIKKIVPGVHWCPDWDYMPICDDSPEKEGCTCNLKQEDDGE